MLLWSLAGLAHAGCEVPPIRELSISAGGTDVSPPAAGVLLSSTIVRGHSAPKNASTGDCSNLGTIILQLGRGGSSSSSSGGTSGEGSSSSSGSQPTETAEAVGYLLDLTDGELPDGMVLPTAALAGPDVTWSWNDGAKDDQDAFSFSLDVSAVDLAGNVGGVVTVDLEDDGAAGLGCSTAPAPGGAAALVGALALLGIKRRRRA